MVTRKQEKGKPEGWIRTVSWRLLVALGLLGIVNVEPQVLVDIERRIFFVVRYFGRRSSVGAECNWAASSDREISGVHITAPFTPAHKQNLHITGGRERRGIHGFTYEVSLSILPLQN